LVAYDDYVGVAPDVEVCQEAKDESDEGVDG
jgi:hypothetical protein